MSRWFRHYAGMARDDKLVRVAIRSKQPIERVVWIYAAILESAAEIDDGGRYDFDEAEAAYFLRANSGDVGAITAGLEGAGRIASGCVVKWGDRQFQSDRSATRQAAYRERKRQEGTGDNRHQNNCVTSPSRQRDAPETETEAYTEKEIPKGITRVAALRKPDGVSDQIWLDFKKQRKKPVTQTALDGISREAAKAGVSLNEALTECCERGWQGFKAEWHFNGQLQQRDGKSRTGYGVTIDAADDWVNGR